DWQGKLLDVGVRRSPRLFVFDPLARMKTPLRDENAQKEMAAVIEFMRLLRDQTGAAVAFVHHTGHNGGHMRGSSDLESVWETRLGFERQEGVVKITPEHREAETSGTISYRLDWDEQTRTIRLAEMRDHTLAETLLDEIRNEPG